MAQNRLADTSKTETILLSEVHAGDLLLSNDGGADLYVFSVKTLAGNRIVEVFREGQSSIYTLRADYEVQVRAEFPCDCHGSGAYAWGAVENGKPAKVGPHFACREKGYQTRSDVIRNITYWNKYARISA
jgi:hypothetical protein